MQMKEIKIPDLDKGNSKNADQTKETRKADKDKRIKKLTC